MSKKNLAKTAIEGGRGNSSKWYRHARHGWVRAKVRAFVRKGFFDRDRDVFERVTCPDLRDTRNYSVSEIVFADKINPIKRWLDSRVGRPWSDVYSEIKKKFDCRTTAGRHILYGHLLYEVENDGILRRGLYSWDRPIDPNELHVADDGILRGSSRYRFQRASRKKAEKPKTTLEKVREWVKDRKIRLVGSVYFWYLPTCYRWVSCSDSKCVREHREIRVGTMKLREHYGTSGVYRQDSPLTPDEVDFWIAVPDGWVNEFLFESKEAKNSREREERRRHERMMRRALGAG